MKGWGGHTKDGQSTGGDWDDVEQTAHINELELKAAFFTLLSFCKEVHDVHIRIMMDNTCAIACVNKFGSMKPKLMKIAREIYAWSVPRNVWLSAAYIPGVQNILADKESRTHILDKEWRLKKKWFDYVVSCLGVPDIDLFASRINKQIDCYASWRPDPDAVFIDAFSESWASYYSYIFPPFSVIARVLRKLCLEGAEAIMVYPHWPTQAWFPRLMQMTIGDPIVLPWGCLEMPQRKALIHPLDRKLHLRVSRVSGANIWRKV